MSVGNILYLFIFFCTDIHDLYWSCTETHVNKIPFGVSVPRGKMRQSETVLLQVFADHQAWSWLSKILPQHAAVFCLDQPGDIKVTKHLNEIAAGNVDHKDVFFIFL